MVLVRKPCYSIESFPMMAAVRHWEVREEIGMAG